jgi:hypothetical protein
LYNIPLSEKFEDIGHYWNPTSCQWEVLHFRPLLVNNERILLVPKNIVRQTYIYSVGQYISQFIIPERQQYHRNNMTQLALKYSKRRGEYYDKPAKKLVYTTEIKGTNHKAYAQQYGKVNPRSITDFRKYMYEQSTSGKFTLSDEELDYIVYKKLKQIS